MLVWIHYGEPHYFCILSALTKVLRNTVLKNIEVFI